MLWQYQKYLLNDIFLLHGFPKIIILDRENKFTSALWKDLHKEMGTHLSFNSSYHPKFDGQIERVNQVLEYMLRMYYMDQ